MLEGLSNYLTPEELAAMRAATGSVTARISLDYKEFKLEFDVADKEFDIILSAQQAAIYGLTGQLESEIGHRIMAVVAKAMTDMAGLDPTAIVNRVRAQRKAERVAKNDPAKGIFDQLMNDDPKGDEPVV